jgi:hypothetical protein
MELLQTKAELERELGRVLLHCRRCNRRVHWVSWSEPDSAGHAMCRMLRTTRVLSRRLASFRDLLRPGYGLATSTRWLLDPRCRPGPVVQGSLGRTVDPRDSRAAARPPERAKEAFRRTPSPRRSPRRSAVRGWGGGGGRAPALR